MQEQERSRYFAGRQSQALCHPIAVSRLPVANANCPPHLSRWNLLYRHLAEATGRAADARVSPDHDDGIPGCETSTARVRIVKSLSRWARDGRSFAVEAVVQSLRMWVEGYHFPPMEVVSTFLVVRGTQPARPPDGTNLLQPAPVDLRSRYRSGALVRPSSCVA
jgi:hypothetical protein